MLRADRQDFNLTTIPHGHRHFIFEKASPISKSLNGIRTMSDRSCIKYPGCVPGACQEKINNMYIKYTFVSLGDFASLLVLLVLGAVAFPVTFTLAVEALHS